MGAKGDLFITRGINSAAGLLQDGSRSAVIQKRTFIFTLAYKSASDVFVGAVCLH